MNEDLTSIRLILQGKKDHYAILMNKYHNEIYSFVFNMLGNYEDTEDLVQEIFIKVYHNLSKYNSDKSGFRTWLYRISSNHTLNYLKSSSYRKRSNKELDVSHITSDIDIENEVIKERQIKSIITIMKQKLSVKHQKILMLHYFSGLSVQEISKALDIPQKTIYKALKSSIEKIKKEVSTNEQTY